MPGTKGWQITAMSALPRKYTISETAEVQGINEQGYIHSIVTKVTWGECVCGLQGRWTEKRDVYTPVP